MTNNWLVGGVLVLLFITLTSFALVGTKQFPIKGFGLAKCDANISYTENVPYAAKEYYTELVPSAGAYSPASSLTQGASTRTECIDVPYTARECIQEELSYTMTDKRCFRNGWNESWANVQCTLKNNDSIGAYFTVFAGFEVNPPTNVLRNSWERAQQVGQSKTVYLYPQSTKTFEYNLQTSSSTTSLICYCSVVSAPTKQVCSNVQMVRQECHEVVSYNTLSGDRSALNATENPTYRNETKSMMVTRYRSETKYQVVEESC